MNEMVQDLLDVSRMEAGQYSLNVIDQDLAAMIQEAEALLRPMAEQKSILMKCTVEGDLALRIDTHRILRVISNLVGNAIKFTPEGGTVTLKCERDLNQVRFTVSDTGPGIPRELLSHVFDRYWQARTGDRRGAGLGLAIAKGIVEAHGGHIWAESPEGGGADFVFTVPAVPGEPAPFGRRGRGSTTGAAPEAASLSSLLVETCPPAGRTTQVSPMQELRHQPCHSSSRCIEPEAERRS
jgi:two-component system, chemotaxis family, sensor kinase Cph1